MRDENTDRKAIEMIIAQLNKPAVTGSYVSHTSNDADDYFVVLTGGLLHLYSAELKSAGHLSANRIPDIFARFRPAR